MSITVVTDSTAYLPDQLAERLPVRSVPLHVSVDGMPAVDEASFGPTELAAAFARKHHVTTSGATAAELAATYRTALESGADGVVSVHLSRRLSSTWEAARLAAEQVDPDRIRVVDSRSAAMGLGFPVLTAAAAATSGADLSAVEHSAVTAAGRATVLFSVETLDYLRRGGRIGAATAVLGTALSIKPLLHVREGRIEPLEKVRTTSRAMARLLEISMRSAGTGPVGITVHHLAAAERAYELAERIQRHLPNCSECMVSEVGAVIGAHIGPGAVGVVLAPGGFPDA